MKDKMNEKMKACLAPHALMHSLFGLGLGLLLAGVFYGLANPLLGLILMGVAFALDYMRKD